LDVEDKEAMRAAGFPFRVGLVPEWFSSGGDLQLHAVFEKGDDEADARVGEQIADGVKEAVAAEVWDAECVVVQNFDEARIAAAMGGVITALRVTCADEEDIGQAEPTAESFCEQGAAVLIRVEISRSLRIDLNGTTRDVFRADRECFGDVECDFIVAHRSFTVDADAVAGGKFDEQDTDVGVGLKIIPQRIVGIALIGRWRKAERQTFIGVNKSYRTKQERGQR
jgi:hypothetical protein